MEQKKLRWKDVYNENKQRRYSEIVGIKEENVEIESNSFKTLKERKYIILTASIILLIALIWSFKNDIKLLFIVLGFFAIAGICFFVFNYFKFICQEDGLYVRFGFQEGKFKYERLKSVYLSKYNEYSFFIPNKRVYSVVIRYSDNNNRIKELSFPNYFIKPDEAMKFLDNFEIKAAEESDFVQYERFKMLKKIGKAIITILFVLTVLGMFLQGIRGV